MKPQIDLFHQLVFAADDYEAIEIVDEEPWPHVSVYQPDGEWCGATNAINLYSRLSAIREIINWNKQWQRKRHTST